MQGTLLNYRDGRGIFQVAKGKKKKKNITFVEEGNFTKWNLTLSRERIEQSMEQQLTTISIIGRPIFEVAILAEIINMIVKIDEITSIENSHGDEKIVIASVFCN